MDLPSGTVTFLFTDIEGSTRLWEERPDSMRLALARHDALLREVIEQNQGYVFKTMGDAFCAAFLYASDAVRAAETAQIALHVEPWPEGASIKVRMALHTGAVECREGDYFGPPLNRVARLLSIGHGGQLLLSEAAYELGCGSLPAGATIRPLGVQKLKDLDRPETVFQLCPPDLPADFPPLRSLDHTTTPNNLPHQLVSFIGREQELAQVKGMLSRSSMVTLTGSGGCGKTRLALQAAASFLDGSASGVWLVEFASLLDPTLVPQTVATVLGLKEVPSRSLLQILTDHLQSAHVLLVLDNCEHLLDACATLSAAILRNCPQVRILATSREGLGITGERTYRVPSLSLPDLKRDITPGALLKYEAVKLFIDRAQFHQPEFVVTHQNAPALASVCHRLDGIPLAIELAAARVRSLTVEDINSKLDQRFRLLTSGSRTALPRQQTLRSLIDWSFDLLNEAEKALFCRLSVFAGEFTLEEIEQICAGDPVDEWDVVDLLTSLTDKSLVLAETSGASVRYRLLETVRQYAKDRLTESGNGDTWRNRHLDYFLALAEEAEPRLTSAEQQQWLERLEAEHDNLRSALAWSSGRIDDSERGLRLACAIWRFWFLRGHLSEGRGWLASVLTVQNSPTLLRTKVLGAAGNLAASQSDFISARTLYEEGLAIKRELGDQQGIAASLNNLGNVAFEMGDYAASQNLYEESLTIKRKLKDPPGVATSLNNLANVLSSQGDPAQARALYEEALTVRRQLGDRSGIAQTLHNLGIVANDQGDHAHARMRFEESLKIRRELGEQSGIAGSLNHMAGVDYEQGDYLSAFEYYKESLMIMRTLGDPRGLALSLEGLAGALAALGRLTDAAYLWGASERLREESSAALAPKDHQRYVHLVSEARTALADDVSFDRAWQEGRTRNLDHAIESALKEPTT